MYEHLMIDPPWPKRKGGLRTARPNQNRALDYQTMSVSDIFTLLDTQIFPQASVLHHVYLWTVDQFLTEAEREMENRGYRRHARLIWNKENGVAPAFTVRYSHEYLIWFYKPNLIPVDKDMRGKLTTVLTERAREHSRKPNIAYSFVDQLYSEGPRLDVFSREQRSGWDQFGNQPKYFGKQSISVATLGIEA